MPPDAVGETVLEQARDTLLLGGIDVVETREIPYGWQLRGADGEIVNVYTTGKAVAQGRKAAAVKALFDARPLPAPGRNAPSKPLSKQTGSAPTEPMQDSAEPAVRLPPGWSDRWSPGDVPF